MAGWEQELAELLRELGVKQEEPKTPLRPTSKLMHSDVKRREPAADAIVLGEFGGGQGDDEAWVSDLSSMRREIDSIVRQVIHLMQRGDLDKSLKEDVMVVLRPLLPLPPLTQQPPTGN